MEVGDLIEIENSQSKELIGTAIITLKETVTFLDVPTKFGESRDELRKRLESYYKINILDKDEFLKLGFKFHGK